MSTTETFRSSLQATSSQAKAWFLKRSTHKTKVEFMAKGQLDDQGIGAVYMYLNKQENALYIGETGGKVKNRIHFQTSRHIEKEWWDKWTTVRFINIQDRTDRITLELLLILAFQPEYNEKPGKRVISEMYEPNKSL